MKREKTGIRSLSVLGLMAALVFSSNYIQFMIPTPLGTTRIHIANGICLLGALLFGGVKGGMAAGIGSFFYDLTFPEYVATSWVTFIMKFLMALICGLLVYAGNNRSGDAPVHILRRVIGSIAGALSYVAMYVAKQFIEQCLLLGVSFEAVALNVLTTKLPASLLNAALAVPIAVMLHSVLRPALQKAKLSEGFGVK